tara:strand:+ start:2841 stop:3317 length:477 start_codon:yes stop_codon:yes gene_type:complete
MKNKLYNIIDLKKKIDLLRNDKKSIGFTNGCFDLLHEGHLKLIAKSRNLCDYLIVGLNSDSSVKKIKGQSRPIDNEIARINKLSKQSKIDAIIIFSKSTPLELIKKIKPQILFKGSDYKDKIIIGEEVVKKDGGKVVLIDILKGHSTTNSIKKRLNNE